MGIEGKNYERFAQDEMAYAGVGDIEDRLYHLAKAQVYATLAVAEAVDDLHRNGLSNENVNAS